MFEGFTDAFVADLTVCLTLEFRVSGVCLQA